MVRDVELALAVALLPLGRALAEESVEVEDRELWEQASSFLKKVP